MASKSTRTRPKRTEPGFARRYGGRQLVRLSPVKGLDLSPELVGELVETSGAMVVWPVQ